MPSEVALVCFWGEFYRNLNRFLLPDYEIDQIKKKVVVRNPGSIYHSICAFANDFDDLGGGYIIVGVDTDDKTGMAIRPVEGVPMENIDNILQEMVSYNNKMTPYYLPRTSVEEVDGKQLIVIWCPAGSYRPYSVPVNVTAKGTKE